MNYEKQIILTLYPVVKTLEELAFRGNLIRRD